MPLTILRRIWPAFRRDGRGVAAIEFAIIAPIICLVLAAMLDFGLLLFVRFGLNENVSASTNYAIVNAAKVNSTDGATLATNLTAIIPVAVNATVVVNNGPQVTRTSQVSTASGTASNANSCYCPTVSGSTVTWGSAVTCGSTCTGSGFGGKFVSVRASTSYTALLGNYGIVQNGTVSVDAVVQVQ
jgi:Flp pilus assembly protein TadG